MTTLVEPLKAPFPWFGGKRRCAHLVWERFGDVANYVEPFAGSLAVLLGRPTLPGLETVNDKDCYVANFWRALQHDPEAVAEFVDNPVNEADLHARHLWLHQQVDFRERMKTEHEFYDAQIAGYWCWGLCSWIGDNFCRPREQHSIPHLGNVVTGVNRKIPHLGDAGRGVNRKIPHLGNAGRGVMEWLLSLAARLRRVRVCCGEWDRVTGDSVTWKHGVTGVLLDPPYDTDGHDDVYGEMSRGLSGPVRAWALEAGKRRDMRIALCGYEGEHVMPADWECVAWGAGGGYGNQNAENLNRKRERIWFSPHCLRQDGLFGGLSA